MSKDKKNISVNKSTIFPEKYKEPYNERKKLLEELEKNQEKEIKNSIQIVKSNLINMGLVY